MARCCAKVMSVVSLADIWSLKGICANSAWSRCRKVLMWNSADKRSAVSLDYAGMWRTMYN